MAGVYLVFDERFQYVNSTFAGMFGYTQEEFVGTPIRDLVLPDFVGQAMEYYRRRMHEGVSSIRYFTRCRHRDGHVVHIEVHGSRVDYRGQAALAGVVIDVSERVRRDQDLHRSRRRLRELASYLNSSREELRSQLAREVHDVLGGMLSSIKLDVFRIQRRSSGPALAEIQEITQELLPLVQDTIDTARQISDELRPRMLDTLGLVAAIRSELEAFGRRNEILVGFMMEGAEPELSAETATQCFRVFQEALTNVGRHAQAETVEVRVRNRDGRFEMQVRDDGKGIDRPSMREGSIGMLSMAERARSIGGSLYVHARAGGGTVVLLAVPGYRGPRSNDRTADR
ncbi:Two-component system sensor kinase [Aromatoleum aromaticum EbN1]|uniref:histidine kinase n=1 Tax=Aromatoleum aromaticum (strain DSM 19018 / LMG 30748 / EbN1) TaxID=76114 RepID=Q5NZZ4_AROAE|nr:Two-component system sensor kinase [Aromatoleum aromaticum EbN1]